MIKTKFFNENEYMKLLGDLGFKGLETALQKENTGNYPPYNTFFNEDDTFVIEIALAGFKKEDIEVKQEDNILTVKSIKVDREEKNYVHHGISSRQFTRTFSVSDSAEVSKVQMVDGMLRIEIEKVEPEKNVKSFKIS